MNVDEKIATVNYIFAVNLLVGNLEVMLEDEDYKEDRLIERLKVVDKFRIELERVTGIDKL